MKKVFLLPRTAAAFILLGLCSCSALQDSIDEVDGNYGEAPPRIAQLESQLLPGMPRAQVEKILDRRPSGKAIPVFRDELAVVLGQASSLQEPRSREVVAYRIRYVIHWLMYIDVIYDQNWRVIHQHYVRDSD